MVFGTQLHEKKLLSKDRSFQEAVADEIAAKESMQVQQQLPQPVSSVTKDSFSSPASSRGYTDLQFGSRQGARQPSNLSQETSYTCFSCGSLDHLRPKCKFRNAVCRNCNVKGNIARVCKKGGINTMCINTKNRYMRTTTLMWFMTSTVCLDLKFLCS